MSTPTQSPVMPSSSSPARRGPRSRPTAVAGNSRTCGRWRFTACANAAAQRSGSYRERRPSSTTTTRSAPHAAAARPEHRPGRCPGRPRHSPRRACPRGAGSGRRARASGGSASRPRARPTSRSRRTLPAAPRCSLASPRRRLAAALGQQPIDRRPRLLDRGGANASSLRGHVAHREHARGRARLPEPLVVGPHVGGEIGRLPDLHRPFDGLGGLETRSRDRDDGGSSSS